MKRVLIITYYWPPAGGPGVQRWLNFVKYFKEFDIEPIVYIPENPHYPLIDESFVNEIPSGIEIIKTPIKEPYRFARLFSKNKTKKISSGIISKKKQSLLEKVFLFIRGNFFIPDARIGWVTPSVSFLKKYIEENPVDVIVTSGPPHSLHLIGMELKSELNIPWLSDFRDPWTTIHYHKSLHLLKYAKRKHKELEAEVLNRSDRVVVTSPTTKKEFETLTETPIDVITNGFEVSEKIHSNLDTSFSIAHIGSLLSERNPIVLWKVLSEICKETPSFSEDLKIKLAGTVSEEIIKSITDFGLLKNLEMIGYVSHKQALQLQANAQVLLLLEINSIETRAIIPGKLFEYLAAKRPIIALGPNESDIEGIINETKSGCFFNYFQEEELKTLLLNYYESFKKGNLKIDSENISKYNRKELTRKMAKVIQQL